MGNKSVKLQRLKIRIVKNIFFGITIFFSFTVFAQTKINRIVSLSPAGTEIIFALGAQEKLVARTDFCTYPDAAKKIKSVGGFGAKTISIESIISFNPDFVYGVSGMHEMFAPILESLGIQFYLSSAESINAVYEEIIQIGKITGRQKKADEVVNTIKQKIQNVSKKIEHTENTPKVYFEISNNPYMSVGKKSFINDLICASGGKNIFDSIQSAYPIVSQEAIIAQNPNVIIHTMEDVQGSKNAQGNTISNRNISVRDAYTTQIFLRAGWNEISAIKNAQIYFVDPDIFTRPGPRMCDAIEILYSILYSKNNAYEK